MTIRLTATTTPRYRRAFCGSRIPRRPRRWTSPRGGVLRGTIKNGGYVAFEAEVDEAALTMTVRPAAPCIHWDNTETVGYTSMPRVAPDEKTASDYFGNPCEGERLPGPFVLTSDEATFSIDPRRL